MLTELMVRFLIGGVVVSAFAVLGDVLRPRSFAGLFGAAPSVALATIGLAFSAKGGGYVATEGRSMLLGAVALGGSALLVSPLLRRLRLPAPVAAGAGWAVWGVAAFGAWEVVFG